MLSNFYTCKGATRNVSLCSTNSEGDLRSPDEFGQGAHVPCRNVSLFSTYRLVGKSKLISWVRYGCSGSRVG